MCKCLNCQVGDIVELKKEIDNKLLELLLEEKDIKLKGGLYHLVQVKFTYNSNHIEGSKLSEEQTRYIYKTYSIISTEEESISLNDINETLNYFGYFDYIIENLNILNEELHKILKINTSDNAKEWFKIGDYKLKPNVVRDKKASSLKKVKREIQKLLDNYSEKKM